MAAKSIVQIVNLLHRDFYKHFYGKVYKQMVALIQGRSLELHSETKNKLLKLVN